MKNTNNFFDQVKCIIRECDSGTNEIEIREEENQAETQTEGFHPFDIDQIFAN